ncbi:similar to Saccharomyces cerevisiae YDR484W VPS52 Component of the GARP (Golgi-associated retrograde protein) complex [Maudiozyma saulgeensis]|uniref:Similar to Saccharomyces cerevisiae YDR484W VPS52 Component of the GARP (Golgi-associated retrograde protein) complex n=1 Tax=Maudiozyma saulgeensis TaxID=1789683 RepID=A0A1X7R1I3_9SACH|nr:similar to Saccharomyces cerevisiae YDR484W VPS52 Component of the GARP (Golgi-associated retrograde protein) complex [Kazachstania saulgeensis]
MDILNTLLDVENIEDVTLDTSQDKQDIYKSFIDNTNEFTKSHPSLNNGHTLTKDLTALQNKETQVNESIENVIPELQAYLKNFNSQLSDFTTELRFIRHKSAELKNLLDNNSRKLSKISPLVNDLIIPPKIIKSIIHDKITSSWQDNILFIKDKEEIYAKYEKERSNSESNHDSNSSVTILPKDFDNLCELLEILKNIILERSKKFIISRIKLLRSGRPIPSQRVQQQMLHVKQIYSFIIENNYSLALEIRQAYAYTMKWYYKEYFGRYIRSLTILQFKNIDTQYSLGNVLINSSNANGGGSYASTLFSNYLGSNFATTVTNDMINEYFQILKRLTILTQEDNTVMVSQIAEHNNNVNFIEIGFKNLNLGILDNFTVEFNFMKNFFQISDNVAEIHGLLEQIFKPTFEKALVYTENVLINQYVYDIFGVLIIIRVANQLIIESRKRSIAAIEDYMEDQLMLLWPKFQQLIDWQVESLNTVDVSQLILKKETIYSSPNDLTISFAYFLKSLLILTTSAVPENANSSRESLATIEGDESVTNIDTIEQGADETSEPLYNSIIRIRNVFEIIITKFSKTLDSPEKFLSVNYMHLYNMLEQQNLLLSEANEIGQMENDNPILKDTAFHYKTLVEAFNKT